MKISPADINQVLADWGQDALQQTVTQVFHAETGTFTESIVESPLRLVVTMSECAPTDGTAGRHVTVTWGAMVRTHDLAPLPAGAIRRVVCDDQVWDVLSAARAPLGWTLLRVRLHELPAE